MGSQQPVFCERWSSSQPTALLVPQLLSWAVVDRSGSFGRVTGAAQGLYVQYIVCTALLDWNNVIAGQWTPPTTAETTMIVSSTQIKPLSDRMRPAVLGLSHAATIGFVCGAYALALLIGGVRPIALFVAIVYLPIAALALSIRQRMVFEVIILAHLLSIARVVAVPMLIIASTPLANRAAPIGRVRCAVVLTQGLLFAAVSAALGRWCFVLAALPLNTRNVIRQPFALIGADAVFAPIAVSVAAASIAVELSNGLRLLAAGTSLCGRIIHVNLHNRLIVPRLLPAARGFAVLSLYHENDE